MKGGLGKWVRDWKRDLARAAAGAVGSIAALTIAGWPGNGALAAWIALAGLVSGLAACFFGEYILHLRAEVDRLQSIEHDLTNERSQRAVERGLLNYQVALAKREAAINAVDVEIWGGAFNEAQSTGQFLPLEAILARRDVTIKARSLDIPIKQPNTSV